MRWRPIGGIYSRRWSRGYSTATSAIRVTSNMHHWIHRPWNCHMINGWGFPSHVHHGDIGGVQPTLGGPHVRVGRPTYCFHVGPTKLLDGAEVSGSVGQVGSYQRWVSRLTLWGCPTTLLHMFSPLVIFNVLLICDGFGSWSSLLRLSLIRLD